VVLGRLVAVHADQGDAPQCVVGQPVPAAVQPVTVGAPGGHRNEGGAAEAGEGGLGAQPLRVVPGGAQELAGGVDTKTGQGEQLRRGRGDQDAEGRERGP
jgi:hypothetical protein